MLKIALNTTKPTTLVMLGDGHPLETGNTATRSQRGEFGDTGNIESPNLRRSNRNSKCFHHYFLSCCDLKCISEKIQ